MSLCSGCVTVACRYLSEVDQLISYCADIHQPHQVLPDIILVHALDVYASHSAAVIFLSLDSSNSVVLIVGESCVLYFQGCGYCAYCEIRIVLYFVIWNICSKSFEVKIKNEKL